MGETIRTAIVFFAAIITAGVVAYGLFGAGVFLTLIFGGSPENYVVQVAVGILGLCALWFICRAFVRDQFSAPDQNEGK